MVHQAEVKELEIVATIMQRSKDFSRLYRRGPSLYFYQRVCESRRSVPDVASFLKSGHRTELLYATLVAWDMDSRAAKMAYFTEFRANLWDCLPLLVKLEELDRSGESCSPDFQWALRECYESLCVMRTDSRLVSNSKLLHFLFPDILMPMDRGNTLTYLYGNTSESVHKYLEITRFTQDVRSAVGDWTAYLDQEWNASVPKVIDNAIILLNGQSVQG